MVTPQREIETPNGKFRIDLCLTYQGDTIGIECDGEEFHSKDTQKYYDEWRDALILFCSDVSSIFRLKGNDINADIISLIFFIYSKSPLFFDKSKILRYKHTIHEDFYNNSITDRSYDGYSIFVEYYNDDRVMSKRHFSPDWKNIKYSWNRFWTKLIIIAGLNEGKRVNDLFLVKDQYMKYDSETLFSMLEASINKTKP